MKGAYTINVLERRAEVAFKATATHNSIYPCAQIGPRYCPLPLSLQDAKSGSSVAQFAFKDIGMAKLIELTQGKSAIVDDEDYAGVSRYRWSAAYNSGTHYAMRQFWRNGIPSTGYMHRFILDAKKGEIVDHINGNGLDNQRRNLRLATASQNTQNQKRRSTNTSGFKGVVKSGNKWIAQIIASGKQIQVGYYSSPEEAARAYDKKAIEIFGEFARLNFPEG